MTDKRRIGIFGGTFSPPHLGHIRSAERFVKALKLDELIIIPAFLPPHKEIDGEADEGARLEMCRVAFSHIDKARVSDIEIKRGGRSYTYLTLEELYSPDCELYLLIGTDMLLSFDTWKNPERIFELSSVCYVRREEDRELDSVIDGKICEYKERFGADIVRVDSDALEISSSELRDMIKRKASLTDYLSSGIISYIEERGLYSAE